MQQGDFNYYYPYPSQNSVPPPPPASAPAPPFSAPAPPFSAPAPPFSSPAPPFSAPAPQFSAPAPPFSTPVPPFAANYVPPPSDYPSPYPSSYPPPTAPAQQPQLSAAFPQYETHGSHHSQPPPSPAPYYSTYPAPPPAPNPIPQSPYDAVYSPQLNQLSSSSPAFQPAYEDPKFDPPGSYFHGDGVFAYQGNKVEPYGARGTAPNPKSANFSGFDDFGRPIGSSFSDKVVRPSGGVGGASTKIARAVPKAETQEDVKGGVQKFRVKLLAESGGQSTMDVLCQIGLDGIRMIDPSSSRTLRIYPLDTITGCEVTDSSTLSFWAKSSVDLGAKRIRLRSNSYTTNTLLDTVTAATVQFKEMGGRIKQAESSKIVEQPAEKKKGFGEWMSFRKPANEEKDHWVPDEAVTKCTDCGNDFNAFVRKHHCRNCGDIYCDKCTQGRTALNADQDAPVVRVCNRCMTEVSKRLSNAKNTASRSTPLHSHEDLAKKLQEEMERNRRSSSGSRSESYGKRMKDVACPTCTVHLQVQVPISGSETIECGVCQHPFLVSSH